LEPGGFMDWEALREKTVVINNDIEIWSKTGSENGANEKTGGLLSETKRGKISVGKMSD
jgi:hypothetical protein